MADIIKWTFIIMLIGLVIFFWALATHIKKEKNQ